jgi:hypothetical protein
MLPHPIRLRHPWDETPSAIQGKVVYRRRFNSPTKLDSWEGVLLEIDRAIFCGEISLNGTVLGRLESGQFFSAEITALMRPSNELVAEVDCHSQLSPPPVSASVYIVEPDHPLGSPIGDVRLVIRSAPDSD